MSPSMLGSRPSFLSLPEKQALPNETLTSVLAEMDPWDVWPLRLVCKNFNAYILRVLAPRSYVPDTYIYIRRAESWIFQVSNPNYYTPPTATGLTDPGAEGGAPEGAPAPAAPFSHRGQKLQFSALRPQDDHRVSHLVDYVPSRNEERPIIQDKLYDEVEVLFRVGPRYYRHIRLPSLGVDRSSLVMSFDWLELYNIILNMPEAELKKRGHDIGPRYLWIPDRGGRLWMDAEEDSMEFSDSDTASSVAAPASEGGSHFGVSHGDTDTAALLAEPGGVSQGDLGAGVSQGDSDVDPPVAIDVASQGHVDATPRRLVLDVAYESDVVAQSSEDGVTVGHAAPEDIATPRVPRRSFESSRSPADEPFRSSPLTVEAASSPSEAYRLPRTGAIGESFFNFDDSAPEYSSDSAERRNPPRSVESSGGAEVMRREIGVQVHPMQVVITAKFVQRWASWP